MPEPLVWCFMTECELPMTSLKMSGARALLRIGAVRLEHGAVQAQKIRKFFPISQTSALFCSSYLSGAGCT